MTVTFAFFQYVMYIPVFTILLKIPLVMPGISCYLDKIRGGWERKSPNSIAPQIPADSDELEQSKDTYSINFPPQYSTATKTTNNGRMINVRST